MLRFTGTKAWGLSVPALQASPFGGASRGPDWDNRGNCPHLPRTASYDERKRFQWETRGRASGLPRHTAGHSTISEVPLWVQTALFRGSHELISQRLSMRGFVGVLVWSRNCLQSNKGERESPLLLLLGVQRSVARILSGSLVAAGWLTAGSQHTHSDVRTRHTVETDTGTELARRGTSHHRSRL